MHLHKDFKTDHVTNLLANKQTDTYMSIGIFAFPGSQADRRKRATMTGLCLQSKYFCHCLYQKNWKNHHLSSFNFGLTF